MHRLCKGLLRRSNHRILVELQIRQQAPSIRLLQTLVINQIMDRVKRIMQPAEMLQQVLIKMHRVLQQLEPLAALTKVRSRRE